MRFSNEWNSCLIFKIVHYTKIWVRKLDKVRIYKMKSSDITSFGLDLLDRSQRLIIKTKITSC